MNKNVEPLILAVESCTRAGSVCVARGDRALASAVGDETASHSTDLIVNIERTLDRGKVKLSEVDLFAAATGPGSFTGLRIGLATVKALAVATRKPCAAVSTLAAIALRAGDSARTVSILPAGRGELYAQMFEVASQAVTALDRESHISPSELSTKYGHVGSIIFAGEGASRLDKSLYETAAGQRTEGLFRTLTEPLANTVASLAFADYRRGALTSAEELRANYVRPSDAEINQQWQQQIS